MKFKILLFILYLISNNFLEMCEISGEKCVCKKVSVTTLQINCLEKSLKSNTLFLNEIVNITESETNLQIRIENKIFDEINSSSYGKFSLNIRTLMIIHNQVNRLGSKLFYGYPNLKLLDLSSNSLEIIEKNRWFSIASIFIFI